MSLQEHRARTAALLGALILLVFSCHRNFSGAAGTNAVDRAWLCKNGGGMLSQAAQECLCPINQRWNGSRCEKAPPSPAAAKAAAVTLPPQPDQIVQLPSTAASESAGRATTGPVAAPPNVASGKTTPAKVDANPLRRACHLAKAYWDEADQYCHCPDHRVLIGSHCYLLGGRVTDDACRRSVHKGRWRHGVCTCPAGLVFSPARGGCVKQLPETATVVLKRVCESSLNLGKWDGALSRCQCPPGRIWQGELCQERGTLSSRTICESDYYHGKWNAERKTCACRAGSVWYDQSCRSANGLTMQQICTSEANRGAWNASLGRCICPGLEQWDVLGRVCR